MKKKTNVFLRDVKLVKSAKRIYRFTKIISAFSVLITAGVVGMDLVKALKN